MSCEDVSSGLCSDPLKASDPKLLRVFGLGPLGDDDALTRGIPAGVLFYDWSRGPDLVSSAWISVEMQGRH